MGNIRNHYFLGVFAVLLVLGTMTENIEASPSPGTIPTDHKGCPLLPAPHPSQGTDDPTRVCETDKDCGGRRICCPTGACCGTYCYDPHPVTSKRPRVSPWG
ncbi:uromodulin-like 1 [Macrobrachium nipponense]|uniref:uromodulin-like 1 n=1 Tax=Macrobrachium nipponense TaxID=159736 RepID=UPI0030C7B17F